MNIAELNQEMSLNRKCGNCPMKGKVFVGADSHDKNVANVDILFLGLNPGVEEAKMGLPFVGPSGKFLREAISGFQGSWAIINSILCSSPNEMAIPNYESCKDACKGNVAKIWSLFKPKIIIPCGNGAASMFEIKEGITRAENIYYISRGRNYKAQPTVVAPIQHPSALIRSGGKSSAKYVNWHKRINEIFQLSKILGSHESPEKAFSEIGVYWQGLFGYA